MNSQSEKINAQHSERGTTESLEQINITGRLFSILQLRFTATSNTDVQRENKLLLVNWQPTNYTHHVRFAFFSGAAANNKSFFYNGSKSAEIKKASKTGTT